ncbi:MAG: hypothetical protein RJA69_1071 [Pseudomonadota bacterium]|jgi:hypothetical protein
MESKRNTPVSSQRRRVLGGLGAVGLASERLNDARIREAYLGI